MLDGKSDINSNQEKRIEDNDFEIARRYLLSETRDFSEMRFETHPFKTNVEHLNDAEQKLIRFLNIRPNQPITTWFSEDENGFSQANSSTLDECPIRLNDSIGSFEMMHESGVFRTEEDFSMSMRPDKIRTFFYSLVDEAKIPFPILQVIYRHYGQQLIFSELPLLKKLNFNFARVVDELITAGGVKRQLVIYCFEFFRHSLPIKDLYNKLKGELSSNELAREFMEVGNSSGLCRVLEYCSDLDFDVAAFLIRNGSRTNVRQHRKAFKAEDKQLNALIVLGGTTFDDFWEKSGTSLSEIAWALANRARHENKEAIYDFMAKYFNELIRGDGVCVMEAAIKHPDIGAEFVLKEFTKYRDHESYKALITPKEQHTAIQEDKPRIPSKSQQEKLAAPDRSTDLKSETGSIRKAVIIAVLMALGSAYGLDKCSDSSVQHNNIEDVGK